MKNVVRKLDDIGRVSIPKQIRKMYDIQYKSCEVEIIPTEQGVLIKKHIEECTFCGSTKKVKKFKNKYICETCLKLCSELKKGKSDGK